MRAKFDKILVPIAEELIAEDQQQHIEFDAFFANVMFHEVAHGLGVKNTINGKGTVRDALKEQAGALEEGKADILGLYMITRLQQQGEMPGRGSRRQLRDLPGRDLPLHPLRRGQRARPGQRRASSPSSRSAARSPATPPPAVTGWTSPACARRWTRWPAPILRLQGDGDYEGVKRFMAERGKMHRPGPVRPRPARRQGHPGGHRLRAGRRRPGDRPAVTHKGRIVDIDPVKRSGGCRRLIVPLLFVVAAGLVAVRFLVPVKRPTLPRAVR